MKIGILQCDSVLEEFQAQFGDYPQMFITLFKQLDNNLQFQIYDIRKKEYPHELNECDAYITTGSRLSVYENIDWLDEFKHFLRRINQGSQKLVAVCFAHQLVAEVFGGTTKKSDKGWGVGISTNQIISPKAWMTPYQTTLNIVVSHQDQVTSLPKQANILATSDFCPNFMFSYGENILAIQGHPEFTDEYSETLMKHRKEKIGKSRLEQGISSLQKTSDELLFARWMLRFMSQ